MNIGPNRQIRAGFRRFQKCSRGTNPAAAVGGALDIGDTLLHGAVVIGVAGNTNLPRAFHEGLAQGMDVIQISDLQRTFAAAKCIPCRSANFLLTATEIGQHIGITPSLVAAL